MEGYVKEFKKLEKCKEINLYLKDIILKYMKRNEFPELYQNSIKEQLGEDNAVILEKFYTFIETEAEADDKKIMKVGILAENNYAIDEIENVYGSEGYNLYGYLAEIFVIKNEKLSRDVPDTTFVCEGATLECTSKGKLTQLKVLDSRREILNGARIATKADKSLAEINFIKCGKSSCSFSSSDGWQEVSVGSISNDNEQLLNTSYIMCHKGSKIVILDANCEEIGN